MTDDPRLKRLRFRAWHRGTREADYMMGCFFDTFHARWDEADMAWFEALLDRDDADVLDWVLGKAEVPTEFAGERMDRLKKLDFVEIGR